MIPVRENRVRSLFHLPRSIQQEMNAASEVGFDDQPHLTGIPIDGIYMIYATMKMQSLNGDIMYR